MIYKYIFNNNSFEYLIFIIFVIFFIGYCFNNSNLTSKGVLGIMIGILIAWIFIDFNIEKKKNKLKSIDNMVNKSYLFKDLYNYENALVIYYESYDFGINNILEFKKSIENFLEMMEIYNKIKIDKDINIFYFNKLQNKYQKCIDSFKSLEMTVEYYQLNKFYTNSNKLNNLLNTYIDECILLNNKIIYVNGYNIYKKKLYKDPREFNYNNNYNNNMI